MDIVVKLMRSKQWQDAQDELDRWEAVASLSPNYEAINVDATIALRSAIEAQITAAPTEPGPSSTSNYRTD